MNTATPAAKITRSFNNPSQPVVGRPQAKGEMTPLPANLLEGSTAVKTAEGIAGVSKIDRSFCRIEGCGSVTKLNHNDSKGAICSKCARGLYYRLENGQIVHGAVKQGRNDLCRCGSGAKFKKCCLTDA